MKLTLSQSDLDSTPALFLRSAGYTYIESYHTGKGSFARPLGSGHYPRFHVYVEEEDEKICKECRRDVTHSKVYSKYLVYPFYSIIFLIGVGILVISIIQNIMSETKSE